MTAEDWNIAWQVFQSVADASETERHVKLQEVDREIREAVLRLLARESAPDSAYLDLDDRPSISLGPYRLLRVLGEGGMGTVYLAEQSHPLRRNVAVKLMRSGLQSREARERFEIERRVLALMQHQNIARVFDAGETQDGRPYFAMELVDGASIQRYCDHNRLTIPQRLALLVQVCFGVQHAHSKGIIHRDIKPSNVLVANEDGKPLPKVIDFGVARALEADVSASLMTRFDSVVGTLEYMSPEQAGGKADHVDTRTDVYALGVLAYELLTGKTPLRALYGTDSNLPVTLDQIRLQEPIAPSRFLKQGAGVDEIAAARGVTRAELIKNVGQELDWIVMCALAKEPERRYQTANALALDLQRLLAGDPVDASPPSALYRVRKLAARYRSGIMAAGTIAATLIIATGVSIRQAIRASAAESAAVAGRERAIKAERVAIADRERARDAERRAQAGLERARQAEADARLRQMQAIEEKSRADKAAANLTAQTEFLERDILAMADPNSQIRQRPDPNITVRAALDRASSRVDVKLEGNPEVRASVEATIGRSYMGLGLFNEAIQHLEHAVEIRRHINGERHPETRAVLDSLAGAFRDAGQYHRAEAILTHLLAEQKRELGENNARTLTTAHLLATILRSQGKYRESEALREKVLAARTRILGELNPDTLRTANDLGWNYLFTNKREQAEKLLSKTLEGRRRTLGLEHPDTLITAHNLAMSRSDPQVAIRELREVLEGQRRVLGQKHPATLSTINNLAVRLKESGDYAGARDLYLGSLEAQRDQPNRHYYQTVLNNLADTYLDTGELEKARPIFEQLISEQTKELGPAHPETTRSALNFAELLLIEGHIKEAADLAEPTYQYRLREGGLTSTRTWHALELLIRVRLAQGQFGEAETLSQVLRNQTAMKRDSQEMVEAWGYEVRSLVGLKRLEEAVSIVSERFLEGGALKRTLPLEALESIAQLRWMKGDLPGARETFELLLAKEKSKLASGRPETARTEALLSMLCISSGQIADAESFARSSLGRSYTNEVVAWHQPVSAVALGVTVLHRGKLADADPLLTKGADQFEAVWASIPAIYKLQAGKLWSQAEDGYRAMGDRKNAERCSIRFSRYVKP